MNLTAHRNLFNVDANSWFYKYRPESAFYRPPEHRLSARDIHQFVRLIARAGVDTLVVNSSTEMAWYPSARVPTPYASYRRGDRSFFYGHILGHAMTPEQLETYLAESVTMMDRYLDLAEDGVDWLAETAKACRREKISPWVSIRMNDMHGATKLPQASYLNGPMFRNRDMVLRGTSYNPSAGPQTAWQGLNYGLRAVRDHMLEVIRDPVENYDYEGLELDWTRSPLCCEPDASQRDIDTMTRWHAEIRELTRRAAERIGKPYPLGMRYAGTLDQMRSIGLDLRAMVREGILDFIEPTNTWQSSWDLPCDELREELGPEVGIYGVIELGPNWLHGYLPGRKGGNVALGRSEAVNYRLTPACPPLMRGNAAAKLVLGCDGVSVMNFMPGDQPSHFAFPGEKCAGDLSALRRLDDLDSLRGRPKAYTLPSESGYYRHEIFETIGPFPSVLGPGERRACRIPMCAEPAGEGLELVVQVVVRRKDPLPPVGIYLNGTWPRFDPQHDDRLLFPVGPMTHHEPSNVGLNFAYPIAAVREGWNEVVVMNGTPKDFFADQSQQTVQVESLELGVRPKSSSPTRRRRGRGRTTAGSANKRRGAR